MAHLTEQDRARIVSLLAERRSLRRIAQELADGNLVILMTAGPADEWLRGEFGA